MPRLLQPPRHPQMEIRAVGEDGEIRAFFFGGADQLPVLAVDARDVRDHFHQAHHGKAARHPPRRERRPAACAGRRSRRTRGRDCAGGALPPDRPHRGRPRLRRRRLELSGPLLFSLTRRALPLCWQGEARYLQNSPQLLCVVKKSKAPVAYARGSERMSYRDGMRRPVPSGMR